MVGRLRSSPRLLAVAALGLLAVVAAGVLVAPTVLHRHASPWFPALSAAAPPPPAAAPGPGTYLPAPVVQQAYPLDCEAAALQAALAARGIRVTQQQIFEKLPVDARAPSFGSDGLPSRWG